MRRLALVLAAAAAALVLQGSSFSASQPPAPTGPSAIALDGKVELAWPSVSGASAYIVYRGASATTATTAVTPAGGIAATQFTDSSVSDGTTYYYVVHAVVSGVESADSAVVQATPLHTACTSGNAVVVENCFPGNQNWNVQNPALVANGGIEGYATANSINHGDSVDLKLNSSSSTTVNIEVYRSGYYGGSGARLFSVVKNIPGTSQPACNTDSNTGLVDCSNWSTSYTLTTTSAWPSGVYLLRIVRNDNGTDNQILLVVRDDSRSSDILYGVAVSTFQAYNKYGGKSLYDFNSGGNNTVAGTPRAVEVSFDRPYEQPRSGERDWYTRDDFASVYWLEQSGYDVSYIANTDLETNGAQVQKHKVYWSAAHDEYTSAAMRSALTQARDAGVSLFFSGANADYWKIRFIDDPTTGGSNRIEVCYKSTQSGGADPSGIPTGTWRDPNGANNPENALIGIEYVGDNDETYFPFVVSAAQGADRVYRYTGLDSQPQGTSTSIGSDLVGWEWDAPVNNGFEPAGVVRLSGSPVSGELIQANGAFTTAGSTTVTATKYTAASGALVFATGTNHWNRGLAKNVYGDGTPDSRIQQVTTNVLEDMHVSPTTPGSGIVLDGSGGSLPTAPTNVTATALGSDSVQITWSPVSGASGYNVYRALAPRDGGLPIGALANGGTLTDTSFTDTTLSSSTTYYYVVTAIVSGSQSAASNEASTTTAAAAGSATRIDIGASSSYTSSTGQVFLADTYATGGTIRTVPASTQIANTPDAKLYQSERWGQFTYNIPVVNGTYDVRFDFAETYYTTPPCTGKRIFGMDILNTAAKPDLSNIDICGAAGPLAAYSRTVSGVQVTNGTLSFSSAYGSIDDPTLEAVEVIPTAIPGPTVVSTTPASGATGVAAGASAQATFSSGMTASTLNSSTFTLTNTATSSAVSGTVSYDAATKTATFKPSTSLDYSTSYTATITTGAISSTGAPLSAPYSWSFTTAAPPPLEVSTTAPGDGATGISPYSAVRATFSAAVDPTTLTTSSFVLRDASGATVPASVTYDASSKTATLQPNAVLATSATYTARISTAVKSTGGIALAAPFVWSFTTGASLPAPPAVASVTPTDGTTNVTLAVAPTVTFSEAMDPLSLNATTLTVSGPGGAVAAAVSYNATTNVATVTPSAPLAASTTYTGKATISVRAADGTPLAAPFTWSFTTAPPPTVTSTSPASGTSFVGLTGPIAATFSRSMDASSLTSSSFTVTGPAGAVDGTVSYDGGSNTASFTPTSQLSGATVYTAKLSTAAKSADGAALAGAYSWTFTTAACPCSLMSTVAQPALQNLATRDGRGGLGPWSYELGTKIAVDQPMQLTAIRFFKSSKETGTHTGHIWTTSGIDLADVPFASESASGWQTQVLGTPLSLQPGAVYIVSVNANAFFGETAQGFAAQVVNGPLRSVADGKNGVYGATAGTFPSSSYNSTNYFVDAVVSSTASAGPLGVAATSPANGGTNASIVAPVTATFSRQVIPSTVNSSTFTLTDMSEDEPARVSGTVSYVDATNSAVFTPAEPLDQSDLYMATISGSVLAEDGTPLGTDQSWTFQTVSQQGPLTVTAQSPAAGVANADYDAPVTVTFSRDVDPTTITASTFKLVAPDGTAVSATTTYSSTTDTATLTPSAPLSQNTAYSVQLTSGILGAADHAALTNPPTWSFTTWACPCKLFTTQAPAKTANPVQDGRSGSGPWSYEVGVKFTVDSAATLAGIRFYKDARETGVHTGTLWSSTGVKLATVAFTNETASGWQTATFSNPVALKASTVYVVSVGVNAYFDVTSSGLATQISNGILHSVADGANGVYGSAAGVFPTSTYKSTNYFVDAVIR